MLDTLTVAALTGSAKVVKNYWTSDAVIWRERRNLGQMFFQPYESTKEFIFCARHTLNPLAIIGLAILDPIVVITIPAILLSASIGFLALGGLSKQVGWDNIATFCLDVGNYVLSDLCQNLIDLVLLPLTAVAMITRGISTGLKATGIYDFDTPEPPADTVTLTA